LAEAQQRLEQVAKDVARLSGGGGEREIRVIRLQRDGKGEAAEFTTTDLEGALADLPGVPAGAKVTVVRSMAEGAPAAGAAGEGPTGELQVVRGPDAIREIRVFRHGAGPQPHAGSMGPPGMPGPGMMGPGMMGPGMAPRGRRGGGEPADTVAR
jgi:hypothetical protein